MTWATIGAAGRASNSDDIEIRIPGPVPRCFRILADDVPTVLNGYPGILYTGDPDEPAAVGDLCTSASGRMLLGQSRAGLGFIVTAPSAGPLPVDAPAFAIVRDLLRSRHWSDAGPVPVLGLGGA